MRELITNNSSKLTILFQVLLIAFATLDRAYGSASPSNAATNHSTDENPLPKYRHRFSYNVDNKEGGQHGHQVYLDGRHTSGKYYVKLNGGTMQDVEYYTDQSGYHPKVSYRSNSDLGSSNAANVVLASLANNLTNFSDRKKAESSTTSPNAIPTSEYLDASSSRSDYEFSTTSLKPVPDQYAADNPAQVSIYDFGIRLLAEGLRSNFTQAEHQNNSSNEDVTSALPAVNSASLNFPDLMQSSNTAAYFSKIENDSPQQPPSAFQTDIRSVSQPLSQPYYAPSTSSSPPQTYIEPISSPQSHVQLLDSQPFYVLASSPQSYIQPVTPQQLNPQTNSDPIIPDFLTKLVSEVPSKLIRPIVVDRESELGGKANQTVDSDRSEQYDVPRQQVDNSTDDKNQEQTRTVVEIEPQTVHEHAVYTTTMDIAKSIPYSMAFVPDIDNHLQDVPNQQQSSMQIVPSFSYPFVSNPQPIMIPTVAPPHLPFIPQMFLQPAPATVFPPYQLITNASPTNLPQPNSGILPTYRYFPIPIYQHQPNMIPLNYINPVSANSPHFRPITPNATHFAPPLQLWRDSLQSNSEMLAKRENLASKTTPSTNSIPAGFSFPPPYAVAARPSHLIPYVKQITNYPEAVPSHPFAQHFFKQSAAPVQPHSLYYNVLGKRAPFTPNHPLWHPSQMYPIRQSRYVMHLATPPETTRKTRDSSSERHLQRRVRQLLVEYGGFKPPFVPSTLLEIENRDKDNGQIAVT